jgi:predicted RNA-binding protein YlxR (DUF448 family)
VAAQKGKKKKHIPQRTCVGCRETLSKRELIRIVHTAEGIRIDPTGKLPGRGAYLHNMRSCWEKGLKNSLANALKTVFTEEDLDILTQYKDSLKDTFEEPSEEVTKADSARNPEMG